MPRVGPEEEREELPQALGNRLAHEATLPETPGSGRTARAAAAARPRDTPGRCRPRPRPPPRSATSSDGRAPAKSYRIDYHRELNPEQQAVVFAPDGPTVVVAGAGSGKTRTLVYRVSRLVEDGVAPEALLLLTFTNRAAKEMTRRVEGLLGADLARMTAGTFHSVGARLLRPHADLLGYRPNFSILDAEDSKDLLESATSDLGIPITERRFPKGDLLRAIVSFAANTGQTDRRRDRPRLPAPPLAARAGEGGRSAATSSGRSSRTRWTTTTSS